jgi:glycosyltransferase involved in cell wall biosynthesis
MSTALGPSRATQRATCRELDVPPMKLLFVGTNQGGGGTESHFVTLAAAMAGAGHEVSAVVRPGDYIHRALEAAGGVRLFGACFERRNDVRATREVVRAAREVRPDWMVGSFKREYWPLAVAARLLRVPLVLFSHLDQRMQPLMVHGLPRVVRRIIAPSEYQRRRLVERGMPASRVAVQVNPIDTAHFRPNAACRAATRACLGFAPDDVVVTFVGRQEHGKGVGVLAEALDVAMTARPSLRMLWVGHPGDDDTDLRGLVARSRHAARHVWRPWSADVAPFMRASDVLALPSIGRETFGLVLAEAQACGVPVLGSATGGIPEAMADGESGLIVPPGDVAAWADALVRLADDEAWRTHMGRAGRRLVERRFAAPGVAAQFARLLYEIAPDGGA